MAAPFPSQDLGLFLQRVALPPGWHVVYEPVVESTMDLAREAAFRGWPDGSIFVADFQTSGRGRHARRWEAPAGRALLFTILLRLDEPPLVATMLSAVAVAEAIERLTGLQPSIKWPNDLLLEGQKTAGILAESYSGPPDAAYVLVGCGLNVNQAQEELGGLGRPATSLSIASGRSVHRGELLVVILEQLEEWLRQPPAGRAAALRLSWENRLWSMGETVAVRDQDEDFTGVVEGVGADGALLVRTPDGMIRSVLSGEIIT